MSRSARIAGLVLPSLLLCLACNSAQAPEPEVAHAAPAHTVQAAPPAQLASAPAAATSCGGENGSCCGGQGEGTCGQGSSCGSDHAASCGAQARDSLPAEDAVATLTRVADPSQVCMVRNHFMGRPQLAIQAEGSTYYGCCPGCANRLLQDARARQAIDPVTHNPVDKGLAVLGKTSRGAVLYFENETNLELFRATMQ